MPLPDDAIPINQLPDDAITIQQPQPNKGNDILSAVGLGGVALGGAGVYGATKAYKALSPQRNKLSGELINSIIKPRHKDYMFGKNPGKGVAQEGIWGLNINSIGNKVEKRLNELNTYAKHYRSLPENQTKTVDLSNALDPFYKAMEELGKAPETHKAKINEIDSIVKDLEKNLPKGLNIKEVPVETAYSIKNIVEGMQKWNVESQGDHILNSSLKNVYHNIDASIDTALPELKSINSRMANLISAKQAIRNRAEVLSRSSSDDLLSLASLPLKIASTPVKSGIAKILSEKFGMVAKKGATGLMAIAPILDAIRYADDPQAYLYQLETGNELSPKGSLEREIETGGII